jgi:hypothetical protein
MFSNDNFSAKIEVIKKAIEKENDGLQLTDYDALHKW